MTALGLWKNTVLQVKASNCGREEYPLLDTVLFELMNMPSTTLDVVEGTFVSVVFVMSRGRNVALLPQI